ncbi:MAG: polysulfide reductase NrfD [Coriobacteriales bacterium]|jgi:formate-dependent nitrite reductase membrane component NrfD|nr:polysulfide reductase NrfD [Coriobacteriales bacterium]
MIEVQTLWEWQIAIYLFLGGLGAGAFITAAVLFFATPKALSIAGKERPLCVTAWVSTACLVIGLLLLLSDLIQPLRGLMLWQSFSNLGSWMTIGAWLVLATVIVFGITAVCLTATVLPALREKFSVPNGVYALLFGSGAFLGLGVALYTGVLLMAAEGIPFWNTILLPCLFTVSALGTGVALIEIILALSQGRGEGAEKDGLHWSHRVGRYLRVGVIVLVLLETAALFVFVSSAASGSGAEASIADAASFSANLLLSGEFAGVFWGLVIVCALILPLAAAMVGFIVKGKAGEVSVVIGAVAALAGGCALRFVVLLAGAHAAPVLDAVTKIIS